LTLQKYKSVITIFCILLLICFLLIGTAAANENKNAANFENPQMFAFDETDAKLSPAAETQVKIGNGSNGGGVRMQIGGPDSSFGGSSSLKWIFIAVGIVLIAGLAYYLLKKK